jgi:hypothetical protein
MRGKGKQEQFSNDRCRKTPKEAPPPKTIGEPAPVDDESFARRAGQIIARAVRGAGHAIRQALDVSS